MRSNASAKTKAVKVHNSVKFDANTPVPIDFTGTAFTTIGGTQYLPFFAPDDTLFRTLLTARLNSPTQDACLNDKSFYSVGDGLNIKNKPFPEEFDRKINGDRQTIDDILKAVFDSLWQDGNKFLEVVKVTIGSDKFVHVYSHNNLDCRFEEKKGGGNPTHVLRTRNFRQDGMFSWSEKTETPVRIPLWTDNPLAKHKPWLKQGNVERTMIHIKNTVQGIDYYGLPSNFSGFLNAILEYKKTRFDLDNFDNNMFLSGILFISGNMSDPESKKLTQNLRKMYTGEGKSQRVLPISSEGGLTDTKFVPFTEKNEGHFLEFDKNNVNKIITANNWSKALMDLNDGASLGKGGEYIKNLFKMKFRTVIMPAQQNVLNNFIFPLMQIIDEHKGTKFYSEQWYIKPVIPITLEGLLDMNALLTVDEGREEIGKGPLDDKTKGQMMISEVAGKKSEDPKKKEVEK